MQWLIDHHVMLFSTLGAGVTLGTEYWLGKTDSVAAGSIIELILNGLFALKEKFHKKAVLIEPVPTTGLESAVVTTDKGEAK